MSESDVERLGMLVGNLEQNSPPSGIQHLQPLLQSLKIHHQIMNE